mmetsp:Transcript_42051/g.106075  ORF Transcript_42051/g.106075 Transcript_42051/m.106075 type:complete len:218 (+) Transcript_42051:1115-1768(+)
MSTCTKAENGPPVLGLFRFAVPALRGPRTLILSACVSSSSSSSSKSQFGHARSSSSSASLPSSASSSLSSASASSARSSSRTTNTFSSGSLDMATVTSTQSSRLSNSSSSGVGTPKLSSNGTTETKAHFGGDRSRLLPPLSQLSVRDPAIDSVAAAYQGRQHFSQPSLASLQHTEPLTPTSSAAAGSLSLLSQMAYQRQDGARGFHRPFETSEAMSE